MEQLELSNTKSRYYYIVNTLNKKIIEKLNSEFRKFDEDKRPVLITTPHTPLNKVIKIDKYNFKQETIENWQSYNYQEKRVSKDIKL